MNPAKSLTEVFCDRKNGIGKDPDDILYQLTPDTYGILVYQEDILLIAQRVAGFSGSESLKFLKGIAKKKADIVFSFREKFVNGVERVGKISKKDGEFLFDQISAAARYSFNKCLSPTTLVDTPNGSVEIAKVRTGDEVNTPEGVCKVENVFFYDTPRYQFSTDTGKVECSPVHKFVTPYGKQPLIKILKKKWKILTKTENFVPINGIIQVSASGRSVDLQVKNNTRTFNLSNGIVSSNSHSVGYALTGYWTAWAKAHYPQEYICAWLRNAKNEADTLTEIRSVISESRRLKIPIVPPSIKQYPVTDFDIAGNKVTFGLSSIKNCGEKSFAKVPDDLDLTNSTWIDFLINHSHLWSKTQIIPMIRVGCFDEFLIARMRAEFEYSQWSTLNKTEMKQVRKFHEEQKFQDLISAVKYFLENGKIRRDKSIVESIVYSLENPPISLNDSVDNIVDHERQLLGTSISARKMNSGKIPMGKHKCKDVKNKAINEFIIAGEITDHREFTIKNGKLKGQVMASFKLVDLTGECDCVCFPSKMVYENQLYDNNIIMLHAKRSDRGSLILEEVWEL
jgi:DNA polymerase III alpha subunit